MEPTAATRFALLILLLSAASLSTAQEFDFFYFVQQWPGSYCDTKQSCCYPRSGKPAADFGIHGLWPNYNDGSYPSNCDPGSPYDASQISDLLGSMRSNWPTLACPSGDGSSFWSHEWEKHGTCSESTLNQRAYFKTALDLKKQVNLLKVLRDAGIRPDGGFYSLGSIVDAATRRGSSVTWMRRGTGSCTRSTCAWMLPGRSSSTAQSFRQAAALPALSSRHFDIHEFPR